MFNIRPVGQNPARQGFPSVPRSLWGLLTRYNIQSTWISCQTDWWFPAKIWGFQKICWDHEASEWSMSSWSHLSTKFKRARVPYKQLLHFYTAVICPVLEYAAPAWHHLINRTQAQHLESVQKRAIHIILNFTRGMSYPNVLFVAQVESLETRGIQSRSFFKIFANQSPVFIISIHLLEIPALPQG